MIVVLRRVPRGKNTNNNPFAMLITGQRKKEIVGIATLKGNQRNVWKEVGRPYY